MKKITLSLLAIAAMSSSLIAGGDMVPVEETVVEVIAPADNSGFYVGMAYGLLSASTDVTITNPAYPGLSYNNKAVDSDFNELMILAGYDYNKYIGVEGRYWFGLSETLSFNDFNPNLTSTDTTIDAWGIYLKPQYNMDNGFGVYALLGYGAADMTVDNVAGTNLNLISDSVDGFSWGLGAKYAYSNNVALFIDYVNVYDGDHDSVDVSTGDRYNVDNSVDTWNFGVTYKF